MKARVYLLAKPANLAVLTLALAVLSGRAAPAKTQAAPPASQAPAAAGQPETPQSIFVIPASPKEGRNPFFPRSTVGVQATIPKPGTLDNSAFVLNGIVPNGPRRTAMINSRTFEVGEEGEVRLANGAKVLIKCAEIKGTSVTILIGGQPRELRLRGAL